MKCRGALIILIFIILIRNWSLSSIYVYNPFSTGINPVKPPIYFIDPNNPKVNVIFGDAKTSANITLTNNLALKIYDEDSNGYVYVEGPSPNIDLSTGQYYEVKWKMHITHFEDPIGCGMIVIDVYFRCGFDCYLASIIYYGNYVKAALGLSIKPDPASEGQSAPYNINPNCEHNLKIRVEVSSDGSTLTIKWFIDGNEIYNYTLSIMFGVTVFQSYFGWLNQDRLELKFYAYLDDVEINVNGRYSASEDFEDGIDNIFTENQSGNAHKTVAYYIYPQNSLKIYNEYGNFNVSLEAVNIEGIIPHGFNASIWLNTSTKYTQQIKIINGIIVDKQTSSISINIYETISLLINVTTSYPSTPTTWNTTIKLYLKYEIDRIIEVYYPIIVKVSSP